MSESKINRRNFLKMAGLSTAAGVLVGCGPASRFVVRRPYPDMPEYNVTGKSTYYATTCRECPAGCGLIVRTFEGRAIKVEGNPNHPVNRGKTCSRAQTAVQGLYNPDRIRTPLKRSTRGAEQAAAITWDEAIGVVQSALQSPTEAAFLIGMNNDHLALLLEELTAALGAPPAVRFGALGMFDGHATLTSASERVFGAKQLPFFDMANAEVVFSFGANFLETWISPVAYARSYSRMRKGAFGKRGYLVVFEPRLSLTAGSADEWVAIKPGSEGMLALALGKLIAEQRGVSAPAYAGVSLEEASQFAGVPVERLKALAALFASSAHPLAIPGGSAAAHNAGVAGVQAALGLNLLVDNIGKPGGVFLSGAPQAHPANDVAVLVERMRAGQVKTLFVHGVNPLFEFPAALGFAEAMQNVPQVISFASFPDETALQADFILPDHTPLEGWGMQMALAGSDRQIYSAAQPVVVPLYETRSTADVLLAATSALPYEDEVAFIQSRLLGLIAQPGGSFSAAEINTFWAHFLQYGGWWLAEPALQVPTPAWMLDTAPAVDGQLMDGGAYPYHLAVYPTQLGDGSLANRPWLQETPNPMTTVMWNTWVEIHPDTARELGINNDDVVRLTSPTGSLEATAYLYPAIRPDTIGIPFGQGHTSLGRYAQGRGANPAQILPVSMNEAGDLAFADVRVKVEPTGKRRLIARYEDKRGVYGEGEKD